MRMGRGIKVVVGIALGVCVGCGGDSDASSVNDSSSIKTTVSTSTVAGVKTSDVGTSTTNGGQTVDTDRTTLTSSPAGETIGTMEDMKTTGGQSGPDFPIETIDVAIPTTIQIADLGLKAECKPESKVIELSLGSSNLFGSGSADLTPQAVDGLERLRIRIGEAKPSHVSIVGHTDTVGAAEANLELSRQRAAAVAAILQKSLGAGKFTVDGRGETQPIENPGVDNFDSVVNRRVNIVINATTEEIKFCD